MERLYEDTKMMVEKEIEAIVKKEEMSPADLDNLDKLIDIAKDVCELDEMKTGGYSGRANYANYASYGAMPYYGYGAIMYDDNQWSGNRFGDNRGSSYGNNSGARYARGNSGANNGGGNSGNSYGRYYEDERMMPDRGWN